MGKLDGNTEKIDSLVKGKLVETVDYKDVQKFVCLEKELGLFERRYNNFFYWQHIRFSVCESLFGCRTTKVKMEKKERKRDLFKVIVDVFRAIIETVKLNIHLTRGQSAELLFIREPISSDKFFDTWKLPEEISVDNYRIVPYTKEHKSGVHCLEGPRIKTAIERRIYRKLKLNKKDIKEHDFLVKLESRLKKDFGQSISAQEMEKIIHDFRIQDKNYSKVYSKIFDQTHCKAIAFVAYYSNELFPAQRIAKERGITVIEFQHGVINNHEEYWFEDDRGLNNYTPDYLLTFGDIHNSWIKLVRGEQAIAIGFPYQEKSIKELKDINTNEKEIVIYPESNPKFEVVLDKFINEIVPMGYHVYIKLHPLQIMNVELWYPLLVKNKHAEIVTDQSKGIYYWLKKAKHHVMASTTVGLEAVAFDHTNICIATHVPHDQVQCLLDWNIARGFSTSEQLKDLITHPIDMLKEGMEEIRDNLWKKNASENMTSFFREMHENNWKM